MTLSREKEQVRLLDRELVSIIQDFQILTPLSWPVEMQQRFLTQAQTGQFSLPEIEYPKVDYSQKLQRIQDYIKKLGEDEHPAIIFLRDTAKSYELAYHILQGVGTPAVSEYSKQLYGGPNDVVRGHSRRNIDIARYFLSVVNRYQSIVTEELQIYSAEQCRNLLQQRIAPWIDQRADLITITVDDKIAARAAAGSNYVKIRKDAFFSEGDIAQLLHHEVLTHTLTYINGRKQPILLSLGYSSPRVTATQEGLAVFSEYVNLSIELVRLKRIALRIIALDHAEQGADLVQLFQFFRDNGQDVEESYYSVMRTFRGGSPKGGVIFYKDNVYLRGLLEVEAFLKRTMHLGQVHNIALLFAGKLTTNDVARLNPLIEEGYVVPPTYVPAWARKSSELAAHLAFNDITERFKLRPRNKDVA